MLVQRYPTRPNPYVAQPMGKVSAAYGVLWSHCSLINELWWVIIHRQNNQNLLTTRPSCAWAIVLNAATLRLLGFASRTVRDSGCTGTTANAPAARGGNDTVLIFLRCGTDMRCADCLLLFKLQQTNIITFLNWWTFKNIHFNYFQ